MDTALLIAILSAAVALTSAGIGVWSQVRSARLRDELDRLRLAEQRRHDARQLAARYHEPLARAAYDLQSRLFNILRRDLFGVHYTAGDARSRAYVIDNSAFLLAQYFAWTEIARREVRFIDLGEDGATRRLAELQDSLYGLFQSDRHGALLRVFAGEQRALGERMIVETPHGAECLGYAAFLDRLKLGADPLVEALRTDLQALGAGLDAARLRLTDLQHALIDLLDFLDPQCQRFPRQRRDKV